jgi:Tol biopolymer transport system component
MDEIRGVDDMVTKKPPRTPDALDRPRQRQRRIPRDRKIGTIALSAALVAGAALFALNADLTSRRNGNEPASPPTVLPSKAGVYRFDLRTGQATRVAGIKSPGPDAPDITVSTDGSTIAYEGTEPDGAKAIYVANLDGTNVRALEATAATGCEPIAPQLSPDGSQIAYQAKDCGTSVGDVFLVDVATGKTRRLTDLGGLISQFWYMGPTFSPDGRTVFFTRPSSNTVDQSWSLWSVSASGGKPTLVLPNAIGGRISPDGQKIVYFTFAPSIENAFLGNMWLANANGTDAQRIASGDVFSARWSPDATKIAYTETGGGGAYVVDVATGKISKVIGDANEFPAWLDDHTWIIGVD